MPLGFTENANTCYCNQRQHNYIIKKAFTLMKRQWLCIILFAIGTYRLLVYDSSTIQGYHLGHYI